MHPPDALPRAIEAAIGRLDARVTAGHTFDALALDVHPWHGWLNLSLHTVGERTPVTGRHGVLLADWSLAQFACAQSPDVEPTAWPEGRAVAADLRGQWEASEPEQDDAVVAFYRGLLEACATPALHAALSARLALSAEFRVLTQSFHDHDWFLALRWVSRADGSAGEWLREHWRVERW